MAPRTRQDRKNAKNRPWQRILEDEQERLRQMRGAYAFKARGDGSLVIYPNGDGEPIRVEPHQVMAVLCACGDALARKPSTR